MDKIQNPQVAEIFENYPATVRSKMLELRQLVFEAAEGVGAVEETLKWREPSYLTKNGSTVRMDWKPSPDQYALYFHCQTKLVETFKRLYGDLLKFDGSRAIVFHKDEKIPVSEVKMCVFLALTYHDRKHLPMLGAVSILGK